MVDYGVPVDPSETPRATAVRLGGLPGIDRGGRDPSALLARAEERARYARHAAAAATGSTRRSGSCGRRSTERATPAGSGSGAVLMPRSVILRWRSTWTGWTSRASRVAARVRDATTALSPRRLLTRAAR